MTSEQGGNELRFYALRVAKVERLTDEAVAITFEIPHELAGTFAYLPGQHVTVRAMIEGEDVRRSYSIAADANDGALRIGVKRLAGGAFSTFATTTLAEGDLLDVMPPVGEFTVSPTTGPRYGAVAAGSGITPLLSLISTTLAVDQRVGWTLVFGNRSAGTVMFLEELEGLKDRYTDRLQIVHVLTRESTDVSLFSGRLDEAKLTELFATVVDAASVDDWYLCGPFEVVAAARSVLEGRGHDPVHVHDELFFAGPIDPSVLPPEPASDEGAVRLRVQLEGRTSETRMAPETSILDAAMRVRPELPYSCKGGMCASCKAQLVEGEVTMDKNYALVQADLDAGYILTCQSHPTTERVVVNFDRR